MMQALCQTHEPQVSGSFSVGLRGGGDKNLILTTFSQFKKRPIYLVEVLGLPPKTSKPDGKRACGRFPVLWN